MANFLQEMSQDTQEFWNYWPRKSSATSGRGWLGAVWFGVPVEPAQRSSEVARCVERDLRPLMGHHCLKDFRWSLSPGCLTYSTGEIRCVLSIVDDEKLRKRSLSSRTQRSGRGFHNSLFTKKNPGSDGIFERLLESVTELTHRSAQRFEHD